MNLNGNLDPKKAALLNNFSKMAQGKKTEDMLPLLLAVSNKAKREGINFSDNEINTIVGMLKKDMPPKDQRRIDLFMEMFRQQ